jgi:hypothetical protein
MGSLTARLTGEANARWKAAPRAMPGGQPNFPDLAITTALMLCAVFRMALRQAEGLIGSVLHLLADAGASLTGRRVDQARSRDGHAAIHR